MRVRHGLIKVNGFRQRTIKTQAPFGEHGHSDLAGRIHMDKTLFSKTNPEKVSTNVAFVELRSTRPKMPQKNAAVNFDHMKQLFSKSSPALSSVVQVDTTSKSLELNENSHSNKDFPSSASSTTEVLSDAGVVRRLHAMITNFCHMDDGTLSQDIDLRQYGIDSGQVR